jgi:ACT domain-containing protein
MAAKKLAKDTSMSIDEICASLKISRSTYYRYLAMEPDARQGHAG